MSSRVLRLILCLLIFLPTAGCMSAAIMGGGLLACAIVDTISPGCIAGDGFRPLFPDKKVDPNFDFKVLKDNSDEDRGGNNYGDYEYYGEHYKVPHEISENEYMRGTWLNAQRVQLGSESPYIPPQVRTVKLILPNPVEIGMTYHYQASERDSKVDARHAALREVKRLAVERIGTYVTSETEVENYKVTKDRIRSFAAAVTQTTILAENWDGKSYWMKVKIKADSSQTEYYQ